VGKKGWQVLLVKISFVRKSMSRLSFEEVKDNDDFYKRHSKQSQQKLHN
jgi:hypothetical protein